jgi:hypothetical protein
MNVQNLKIKIRINFLKFSSLKQNVKKTQVQSGVRDKLFYQQNVSCVQYSITIFMLRLNCLSLLASFYSLSFSFFLSSSISSLYSSLCFFVSLTYVPISLCLSLSLFIFSLPLFPSHKVRKEVILNTLADVLNGFGLDF